jgi:hypothetical protein
LGEIWLYDFPIALSLASIDVGLSSRWSIRRSTWIRPAPIFTITSSVCSITRKSDSKSGASIVVDIPPVALLRPDSSIMRMASLTKGLTEAPSLVGKIANSAMIDPCSFPISEIVTRDISNYKRVGDKFDGCVIQ